LIIQPAGGAEMQSILFINYEYPPVGGGGGNATLNFAKKSAELGVKCIAVTSAYQSLKGKHIEDGVTLYRIPSFRRKAGQASLIQMACFVISAFIHLPSIVAREQPKTAVIFFGLPCGLTGLLLKLFFRIPYVIMLQGGDVPGFEPSITMIHTILSPFRRTIYRQSTAVIANSNGLKALAEKADPGHRISVVTNGVDTDYFRPPDTEDSKGNKYTFLFAGRFSEQKNIPLLIKAYARCSPAENNLSLVLIGEGPLHDELIQLARQHNVMDFISWNGWCQKDRLRDFYQQAHCFINPSFIEGMSNAVLEAMSCGLPVIAGDCPGNRELVTDNHNGFIVSQHDLDRLSELMTMLSNDITCSEDLGKNGRKKCEEYFSWSAVTRELHAFFDS
jgi:glycosyltransferase involved in cell wall biosynthesis